MKSNKRRGKKGFGYLQVRSSITGKEYPAGTTNVKGGSYMLYYHQYTGQINLKGTEVKKLRKKNK